MCFVAVGFSGGLRTTHTAYQGSWFADNSRSFIRMPKSRSGMIFMSQHKLVVMC